MGRETLEPHELLEAEDFKHGRRSLATPVALTVAVLAVLASMSSMQAERTAAESILAKNDAILWQARASDEWALRQARSIKLHLEEHVPSGALSGTDADRQRADITAAEDRAREDEKRRDEANVLAFERYEQHHRFAIATSLLQIAIVLQTVAAIVDRRALWWCGIVVGVVGGLAVANGFLGLV
jgi:hypothetical protein